MGDESNKTEKKGDWLLPSIVIVILILLGLSLIVPTFSRVAERSPITKHINNAKQIVTLLKLYSSDHGGAYPATLDELVKEGVTDKATLDRLNRYEIASDGKTREWIVNLDLRDDDPADLPLVVSPAPMKSGKYILGLNDTSVSVGSKKGFEDAMERLRKFREERNKDATPVVK